MVTAPDSALERVLRAHGFPAPTGVEKVGKDGPVDQLLVRWSPSADLPQAHLAVDLDGRRRSWVEVSLAARALAGDAVRGAQPLRIEGLGRSALLQPGPLGGPTRDARAILEALAQVGAVQSSTWGDQPHGKTFVPTAPSWSAYMERRIDTALATAVAFGVAMGGLASALHRHALARREAWGSATFGLVHGDLVPENVRVDETGACALLLGWGDALLGDPLVDWAPAIESPPGALESGLAGRSPDWADDPSAIARLESYVALRALERIVECGRPWLDGGGARLRAARVEGARELAHEALVPDRVIDRLRPVVRSAPRRRPDPRPTGILRRRVLEILRHPLGVGDVLPLLTALSSTALETDIIAEHASPALRTLGSLGRPWPVAPIPDRAAWRAELIADCIARPGGGLAVGLVALALDAVDAVDGEVDDSTLVGIARLGAMRMPGEGWRHAAVGYVAMVRIGGDPSPFEAALTTVPEEPTEDASDLADGLAFVEWWTAPDALWTPVLAWAVVSLPDALRERVAGQVLL